MGAYSRQNGLFFLIIYHFATDYDFTLQYVVFELKTQLLKLIHYYFLNKQLIQFAPLIYHVICLFFILL